METVKTIHIACVALSFTGFFIRGIWMLMDSRLMKQVWVRIIPQLVDTALLVSAITLAFEFRLSPFEQPWLAAKIIALLAYIGIGLVALRFGRTRRVRLLAWLLGMLVFSYIVSVALNKSAVGWFAFI